MCTRSYLKSVLRCKILILDTYHPDTQYLCEKDVRIHGYFMKSEGVLKQKCVGNTALWGGNYHSEICNNNGNAICEQNIKFFNIKHYVHKEITGL